jgi:hypothetical protein
VGGDRRRVTQGAGHEDPGQVRSPDRGRVHRVHHGGQHHEHRRQPRSPPGPSHRQQNIDYLNWLAGSTVGQLGLTLELLGFAAWVLFVGYLCARVRAGGWLATAALTGGIVSIAVKIGSAAPLFTAFLLRNEISPGDRAGAHRHERRRVRD